MIDLPVIFEDESLVVINKPPGIVVNRAQSVTDETVQDWAAARYGSLFPQNPQTEEEHAFVERAGVVHRIDKETSGCLILAKTVDAFVRMQQQFKERDIDKTYLAIAHGDIVPHDGEIHAPVGRLPWNRERFGILPGGKDAVTEYRVEQVWKAKHGKLEEMFSFVELHPKTGRTHQIRVHLKYINHPILGDWQYAGRKTARADRLWAPRVMLHAKHIRFTHPLTGAELAIDAPIPDDMKRCLPA